MSKPRVWREAITRKWRAEHEECGWSSRWPTIVTAHTEAAYHTCVPVLGPRPLPPGTTIVGAGSTSVAARDPRAYTNWWDYSRLGQVW